MTNALWFALGWQVGALTGWGQYGAHFARSLTDAGYRVVLPAPPDLTGILPLDRSRLVALQGPLPADGEGWLFMPLGNALEAKPEGLPSNVRVCALCVFEDSGALDAQGIERLRAYDTLIAPSRWVARMLADAGFPDVPVCHQGYDERVFFPSEGAKPKQPLVFSGGKLEFRKGQDITIDAFRRFRETPEGKDAVLVTAWDNLWPQTMEGIWLSGYVKGVPTVKHGKADIVGWLGVNGIPPEAVIDCGRLSPPDLAHVMRSCTVGVFPSRAEGATNLVLVEALACGLPCLYGDWTGQADIYPEVVCTGIDNNGGMLASTHEAKPIPACRLYRSVEGWGEQPGYQWSFALSNGFGMRAGPGLADYWSWSVRGPAIAETVLQAPIPIRP